MGITAFIIYDIVVSSIVSSTNKASFQCILLRFIIHSFIENKQK